MWSPESIPGLEGTASKMAHSYRDQVVSGIGTEDFPASVRAALYHNGEETFVLQNKRNSKGIQVSA